LEIEGGPSEEYERANAEWADLMETTFQNIYDAGRAQQLWQAGRRSEAEAIMLWNPNVGVEYRVIDNGKVTQRGSRFGQDAADFLNGIDIAVNLGLLSPVTGGTTYVNVGDSGAPQNTQTALSAKEIYSIYRGLKDIGRYVPVCNNFIKGTLEKLTEINPNNPPVSTNIVQLFRAVQNQPNGGFFISDKGYSTVSGLIKDGNAKILYLSSSFIYVSRTIHEGFHISGRNGWLFDQAVAEAISQVDPRYLKRYEAIDPQGKDAYNLYSHLIDNALAENCPESLLQR